MKTVDCGNSVIIIIHEIYGINNHILKTAEDCKKAGFDVIIADLYGTAENFDYDESEAAYEYFMKNVGFEICVEKVNKLVIEAKQKYEYVFLLGFSIGATAAWLCSSLNNGCSGIIGYYGSRIRDYINVKPYCPSLLIFASLEKSFNVKLLSSKLEQIENVEVHILNGKHGFGDSFSKNYCEEPKEVAKKLVEKFLDRRVKNG